MSERKLISSGSSFEKVAGYSRAVRESGWVHVSGTTGYDYTTMTLPEDVAEQTRNALKTISGALVQAGTSIENVVRARYYLSSRADVDTVFKVLGETFADIRPAITMIICDLIQPEMKIEIEVTAKA